MSFDNELDYSKTVVYLNSKMTGLQNQIISDKNKITQLQQSPYASSITSEIIKLQSLIDRNKLSIQNIQAVLAEIVRIQALSDEEKALIYYYYTILKVEKIDYMIKLLFNTHMLTDVNVLALNNDITTPSDIKLMVAKLVYKKIHINNAYQEVYDVI